MLQTINMKAYWDDKLKAMLDFIVNFFSYMVVDNEYSYIEEKYTNQIWQKHAQNIIKIILYNKILMRTCLLIWLSKRKRPF